MFQIEILVFNKMPKQKMYALADALGVGTQVGQNDLAEWD